MGGEKDLIEREGAVLHLCYIHVHLSVMFVNVCPGEEEEYKEVGGEKHMIERDICICVKMKVQFYISAIHLPLMFVNVCPAEEEFKEVGGEKDLIERDICICEREDAVLYLGCTFISDVCKLVCSGEEKFKEVGGEKDFKERSVHLCVREHSYIYLSTCDVCNLDCQQNKGSKSTQISEVQFSAFIYRTVL